MQYFVTGKSYRCLALRWSELIQSIVFAMKRSIRVATRFDTRSSLILGERILDLSDFIGLRHLGFITLITIARQFGRRWESFGDFGTDMVEEFRHDWKQPMRTPIKSSASLQKGHRRVWDFYQTIRPVGKQHRWDMTQVLSIHDD